MSEKKIGAEPVYDARKLGTPRMLVLGLQHMFAMFGATVLVPILTGLDIATTLLFAGLGTLLFHVLTKFKVPAFLGSSFAFLGGYAAIAPLIDGKPNTEMLPYACLGVACAGLMYVILSALFFRNGKCLPLADFANPHRSILREHAFVDLYANDNACAGLRFKALRGHLHFGFLCLALDRFCLLIRFLRNTRCLFS